MRKIFLGKKNYQTFSRKIKIEHISGLTAQSFVRFVFIVCEVQGYQNTLKLNCRSLAFNKNKPFFKKKKSETVLLAHILQCFRKKCVYWYISLTDLYLFAFIYLVK